MKRGAVELARFVAIRDSVARIARILAPAAIEVAPLKGALLIVGYAKEPQARTVGDIDLLVRDERFEEAVAILKAHGAREPIENPDGRTSTLELRGVPFPIDLHRRLCRHALYGLDETAMLDRSHRDEETFGEAVRVLAPEDSFAHAIAHHAGGRPLGAPERLRGDVAIIGPRIDRGVVMTRIREFGLIRALLFTQLDLRRKGVSAAIVDELVHELAPTPVDLLAVEAALALTPDERETPVSSLARHLTNATWRSAARSLAWHVATTLEYRARSA